MLAQHLRELVAGHVGVHALVLAGDDDVDAVGLVADVLVDPLQLDLELLGGEADGAEHAEAAGLGDGDDDVTAVGEGEDRELDAEVVAEVVCMAGLLVRCAPMGGAGRHERGGGGVNTAAAPQRWWVSGRGSSPVRSRNVGPRVASPASKRSSRSRGRKRVTKSVAPTATAGDGRQRPVHVDRAAVGREHPEVRDDLQRAGVDARGRAPQLRDRPVELQRVVTTVSSAIRNGPAGRPLAC